MSMKDILRIAAMMSLAVESNNNPRNRYIEPETEQEKRERLYKAKIKEEEINRANGLQKFYFKEGEVWTLTQKSANRKAKNKGWTFYS